jgi:NAD(P)-dependent dehydrogenase (short-subunit alcohol dehydrogenase family)
MSLDLDAIKHYEPSSNLLAERVILITGAGEGIGRALSLACAAHGATVVLLDKAVKPLEAVYDEIEAAGGAQPAIYPMNLEGATAKDHADLAENLGREFGRLDGLVNNAGWIGARDPIKDYDIELWPRVLMVNLNAPFLMTRACLPLLEQAADPAIVFSTHDIRDAGDGAYGVAKAGQEAMLSILASEHDAGCEHPIRVNGVDSNAVTTQEYSLARSDGTQTIPETVIGPYLYLLGPDAGRLSGVNLRL